MVALKANEVEGALRRLDPRLAVILVYGPDSGLVNERARALAESAVDDPSDPFQLIRLDGDALAADPARLPDEAGTVGLFGARRAIWIKPTSRNLVPAVDTVLQIPLADTRVVIEAGDLAKSSPLRTLCERSPKALAVPCYADAGKDLGSVIDEALKAAGTTITPDARAALLASVGGDRLATRGELAKLLLYVHGRRAIGIEDVDAVVSDVSGLGMDAVVDAAFGGRPDAFETGYRRQISEGTHPSVVLGAALRHALTLLGHRLDIEAGRHLDDVLKSWRGLHFRRAPAVRDQFGRWTAAGLRETIGKLQDAVLDTRLHANLADDLAGRVMMSIALKARSGRR